MENILLKLRLKKIALRSFLLWLLIGLTCASLIHIETIVTPSQRVRIVDKSGSPAGYVSLVQVRHDPYASIAEIPHFLETDSTGNVTLPQIKANATLGYRVFYFLASRKNADTVNKRMICLEISRYKKEVCYGPEQPLPAEIIVESERN